MSLSKPSNQDVNNARFNEEAAKWDANKKHAEGVTKAFEAIQRYIPAFADGTSKSRSSPLPSHHTNQSIHIWY
jgi:hypothetical protein